MKRYLWGIICFSSLVLLNSISHASAIYRYQGENYEAPIGIYDTTMSLTGTVEFATPLPPNLFEEVFPIDFNFNDGVNTFTAGDLTSSRFGFATDSLGDIIGWEIQLRNEEGGLLDLQIENTMLGGQDFIIFARGDEFFGLGSSSSPGSWSVIPVPAALWLFGSGLLGLVGFARRKKVA